MTRFIIFPRFNGQVREALVQHRASNWGEHHREEFSIHPVVESQFFASYGKAVYILESDRPLWRSKGVKRRPNYKLVKGEIKVRSYLEELIRAVDEWVLKNLD